MSSIPDAAAQLPPEFWIAAPMILSILLFGAVALAAVMRARPEDVPRVLSIFSTIITRRTAGQPSCTTETESLDDGEPRPPLPRAGHHGTVKQKGGKGI
jgi:hypothetical protein